MLQSSIYVVDDDEALAKLVKRLFELQGYKVICFYEPTEFLDAMPLLQPGCILSDLRMPQLSGLELLRRVRERGIQWPAVLFSGRGDIASAVEAMRLGATDFVEKPFRNEDLLQSVARAFEAHNRGKEVQQAILRAQELVKSLTPRQQELMRGVADGHSNKVIAQKLGISPRTAEVHRARLMDRLHAKSLAEVVRLAIWAQTNLQTDVAESGGE